MVFFRQWELNSCQFKEWWFATSWKPSSLCQDYMSSNIYHPNGYAASPADYSKMLRGQVPQPCGYGCWHLNPAIKCFSANVAWKFIILRCTSSSKVTPISKIKWYCRTWHICTTEWRIHWQEMWLINVIAWLRFSVFKCWIIYPVHFDFRK